LISSVSGSLITLLAVHYFLKRYASLHQQMKLKHKQDFQELISRIYHKDQIPRTKRIRGLTNLGLPATSTLLTSQEAVLTLLIRMLNQVEMFGREHHGSWAKFALESLEKAIDEHRNSIRQSKDIKEYWTLAQRVSLEHEENVINTVKEFEGFQ
jgi:hypothetical protein